MDPKSRPELAALFLLAVGVLRHYGYTLADPQDMGIVSKGLGGLALLAVIPFAWKAYPSKVMALVLLWWAFEALQVTMCSFAYWLNPWDVLPGQSICSARFGLDLGALGIMAVSLILWRIVRTSNIQEAEKWQ